MKFKIKDEDLVIRDLEEAIRRLPLELRLAGLKPSEMLKILNPGEILEVLSPEERLEGLKPEERLKGLKIEELKKLKEILDKHILISRNQSFLLLYRSQFNIL